MQKSCPRCQQDFECRVDDVVACDCYAITLGDATRAYLSETRYDCLCPRCLEVLDQLVAKAQADEFPARHSDMQEGVHFTVEDGKVVFTEYCHILRGFCCGNGCRHCAYGIHLKRSF